MPSVAIENRKSVREAVWRIQQAFCQLGHADHGFSKTLIWVPPYGVWAKFTNRKSGTGYWNGFGNQLGSRNDARTLVQVNPALAGKPGRYQGVFAVTDSAIWLLHAGDINTTTGRVQLRDYKDDADFEEEEVLFSDGTVKTYIKVCRIDNGSNDLVRGIARFVDACALVRTQVSSGREIAELERRAQLIEESEGAYLVPPQPPKIVERIHAMVWHRLRDRLESQGATVANERKFGLGPDLFTMEQPAPRLFEIKTAHGSSDYLKGVGQLLVYEALLETKFRKVLVIPTGMDSRIQEMFLKRFAIETITYEIKGKQVIFDDQADRLPTQRRVA